ncbi:MAG: TerB family tellurite resistance protein [Rhodospirillaceae bacterium]|jgi:uncharacterized tellurite resistance protein B-like protein|nr:TerB family tellurite resistance protein [Rhodospirillaceae bacterium]MBT5373275.1 TerB family tellurite resistance protein [Rhodospirillaceae bacterium]MBT5659201.1 TerB family tellurite resistance protein [Rhodospirillaceae bacterium]
MLKRVKSLLFNSADKTQATNEPLKAEESDIAACALMVEAALQDGVLDASERETILRLIEKGFGVTGVDAEALLEEASERASKAVDSFGFTRIVMKHYDHEERVKLVEMLWQVIFADGEVHDYEASLMRRVAGLLHIPDRENGLARNRAAAETDSL